MNITKEWLKEKGACTSGYEWFVRNCDDGENHETVIKKLIDCNEYSDSIWLITNILDKTNNVKLAIYSAESVLHIFEEHVKNDDRPRKAIEAAKEYLSNPNNAAADAAYTASDAADAAARAADAAAGATRATARAAAYAAAAGSKNEVIDYGLKLIKDCLEE